MHRSRLSSIIIDCQVEDLRAAAEFWSQAIGRRIANVDLDGEDRYAEIETADDEPIVVIQKVAHESRVHLDIETDDIEAEVKRLEALGAKRVEFVKRWWVMEAPTGHRFCVLDKQRTEFGPHLNTWDD
ncbi:MAG TPA: VOC family protein [Rhodanobacteraceae bacterium]|nr:VOC family protein [Rhodanobacteraceae bacterium]